MPAPASMPRSRTRRLPALLAAALLLPAAARAQEGFADSAAVADSRAARGIAATCGVPVDVVRLRTVRDTVYAIAPVDSSEPRAHRILRGTLMQEVLARLTVPNPLGVPGALPIGEAEGGSVAALSGGPRFDAEVTLMLDAEGHARSVRLTRASDFVRLDAALFTAARGADSAGAFGPLPEELAKGRDLFPFLVRLGARPRDTSVVAVPLAQVDVSTIRPTTPAAPSRRGTYPRYPRKAREAGAQDEIVAQFIVAPDGRVEPRSIRIVRGTYREFATEIVRWLRSDARFEPARVGSCPIRQLVQQPFTFAIRR